MRHLTRYEVWTSCIDSGGTVWSKKMCEVRLPMGMEHQSAIQFLNDHEPELLPEGEEVRCRSLEDHAFRIMAKHDFAFDFTLIGSPTASGRRG